MRNPGLVVALMLLAVAQQSRASEEAAAAFIKAILPSLPVQEEPCRSPQEGAGPATLFVCAHPTADFETFSRAWDAASTNTDKIPSIPKPMTDWVTQVGGRIRWYALTDKWIVVTYDTSARAVLISYNKDRTDVLAMTRGITQPKRIAAEDSSGEARRNSRIGLKPDAQGVVVISAVIRKDGTVGDVEILGCLPRHRGLESAAANAVKGWRYEPATRDGVAVSVGMTSAFTYGAGGSFRSTSDSMDAGSSGGISVSPKGP